jgi:Protein of unknown function with PCYCGC motif
MKRRLIVAALVAFAVVGGGGDWWFRSGADAQVTVDEVGDRVQTVRRGEMPVFAATPEVAVLYRFATEHPKAFKGVECTCGCTSIGHVDNRLCYIKAETADQVTYTSHAAT